MKYNKVILFPILGIFLANLLGCSAMQTEFGKSNLDVQTRMTQTIFLDPVSPEKKRVYVQVRNTSGQKAFNLNNRLAYAIEKKGYILESDPDKAHFMVQANVLNICKMNLREADSALESGFGGGLLGAAVAGIAGGSDRAMLGAGLAGAVVGIAADAMVKDNCYTIITDVQLRERARQASSKQVQWKKYQTRIVSTANKANLKLAEATPILADELVNSIAGLM